MEKADLQLLFGHAFVLQIENHELKLTTFTFETQ